jgi:hypothetical protein
VSLNDPLSRFEQVVRQLTVKPSTVIYQCWFSYLPPSARRMGSRLAWDMGAWVTIGLPTEVSQQARRYWIIWKSPRPPGALR